MAVLRSPSTEPAGVLYPGPFSKVLSPSLRVGFMVTPWSLIDVLVSAKNLSDWHAAVAQQAALAQFIDEALQLLARLR